MKGEIVKALKKVTGNKEIHLETPEIESHGDYSSNVAMQIASETKESKTPRKVAEETVKNLKKDKKLMEKVDKIEVAGPGFINFWIKESELVSQISKIDKEKDKFGTSMVGKGKNNLLVATGWKVYRDNHLGDWGTQFGKQIFAIKTWGNEGKIAKSKNPVKELVSLYVRFHKEAEKDSSLDDKAREWFKKLERGDEEARRIWEKCVAWSWVAFDNIYEKLGIEFSKEFNSGKGLGEAFFEDKMQKIINELKVKKLLKEGEGGAKLVFFKKDKYPPAMILKKDATTLYHTRDLATDKYRKDKYNPELIINEVGSEQTLYFQQLFEIEEMLGWFEKGQRVHIGHGLIRFKDTKMSTRKGKTIWLEEVLNEAVKKAKELGSETDKLAEDVGIGALKWNDLKRDSKTNILFNWDEILNMQGNSGPYLQYTVARTNSVLAKRKTSNVKVKNVNRSLNFNKEEKLLLRSFIHYPEVVEKAAEIYAPNLLCNYLFDLAQKYNGFYNMHDILKTRTKNIKLSEFRLALTATTGQILKNGLALLGIKTPEKM
jgi:arginyl-tRNA synthetase